MRVVRYTHADPGRDGCGEESCLLTTVLDPADLSAQEAIALYPWRWEEEVHRPHYTSRKRWCGHAAAAYNRHRGAA